MGAEYYAAKNNPGVLFVPMPWIILQMIPTHFCMECCNRIFPSVIFLKPLRTGMHKRRRKICPLCGVKGLKREFRLPGLLDKDKKSYKI